MFFIKPFSSKIARKLLAAILLCALIPAATIIAAFYFTAKSYLEQRAVNEMQRSIIELKQNLEAKTTLCQTVLANFLSKRPAPAAASIPSADHTSPQQVNQLFDYIAVLEKDSIHYLTGSPSSLPELSSREKNRLNFEHNIYIAEFNGHNPAFYILTRKQHSVYIAKINNKSLLENLADIHQRGMENCVIFSLDKKIIYKTAARPFSPAEISKFLTPKPDNHFYFKQHDTTFFAFTDQLAMPPLTSHAPATVLIYHSSDQIFQPLLSFGSILTAILAVNICIVFLICIFIVSPLNNHIKKLYDATAEITNQNFNHQIHIRSHDEFEALATSFNDMASFLQQTTMTKDHLATTLRSIADGVIVTDQNEKVVMINKTAQELTGWQEQNAEGKSIKTVFNINNNHNINQPSTPHLLTQVLNSSENSPVYSEGAELLSQTGSQCKISYNAAPIRLNNNQTVGAVVVFRDMTEREKLEDHLRQMQKMEAVGTMAGGIAHDFNNILGVIMGYLELTKLHLTTDDHEIEEKIEPAYQAAVRAKDLVTQILTFCRQSNLEKKPVMLIPLIKEVAKMLRSTIPATIRINTNLNVKQDTILADPTQVHQVLMNLCTNSYHAMRDSITGGGVLSLTLSETSSFSNLDHNAWKQTIDNQIDSPFLLISIADTGHGIPKSYIDRIFDPYFTTKQQGEGTGLGLAVVKGIVEEHGGFIDVNSSPGKTTFDLYFPLLENPDDIHIPAEAAELPKGDAQILLVDDDKDMISTSTRMLEFLGYTVYAHTNSLKALQTFRETPDDFDLVITDQTMPFMTGSNLVKKIHQIKPAIPIIICTGYSEDLNEESAKALGVNLLIYKPFNLHLLANAMHSLLSTES